jgi:hypothetical protein
MRNLLDQFAGLLIIRATLEEKDLDAWSPHPSAPRRRSAQQFEREKLNLRGRGVIARLACFKHNDDDDPRVR